MSTDFNIILINMLYGCITKEIVDQNIFFHLFITHHSISDDSGDISYFMLP